MNIRNLLKLPITSRSKIILSVLSQFVLLVGLVLAVYLIQTQKSFDLRKKAKEIEVRLEPSLVKSITTIKENGGRVDWSHSRNNLIAFDRQGEDGFYDVYTMKPDGSDEQCLTCNHPDLPNRNIGNPAWHPSGRYIVFIAEKGDHPQNSITLQSTPGSGQFNDLWLINTETKKASPLRLMPNCKTIMSGISEELNIESSSCSDYGVLHPHFSYDGTKFSWSEMYRRPNILEAGEELGLWKLMVADFRDETNDPKLENIREYQPGDEVFYENHGFSPEGAKLSFTSNFKKGAPVLNSSNIYTLQLDNLQVEPLTGEGYNEHAIYSLDGTKIVWMTNLNNANKGTDWWLMKEDGSEKTRLTYFNKVGSQHYEGKRLFAADSSWSPEGNKIVSYLQTDLSKQLGRIVMLDLSPPSACEIKNIRKIAEGAQAHWSQTKNLIVFSKKVLGIMEIFTMNLDRTNLRCLTCGKKIPGTATPSHKGQAAWHPSGELIAFLAINDHGDIFTFGDFPGVGANVDVYIMTVDGEKYWQVTDYPKDWGALYPAFSHDGTRLSWAEEYSCSRSSCPQPHRTDVPPCCALGTSVQDRIKRGTGEELGNWQIKVANISFDENGPVWETPVSIPVNHEGKRMLESAGFTPDDTGFIFESVEISESNNHATCADIYTSDLQGNFSSFKRLTKSPLSHEKNAAYSPNGQKIAHSSGPGVGIFYKTDMYLMNADGLELPLEQEQKLTYFHDSTHPCKSGEFACYDGYLHIVGDPSWSPDGRSLLFWSWDGKGDNAKIEKYNTNFCDGSDVDAHLREATKQFLHRPDFDGNMYMVEFEGACGNS